MVGSGWAFAGQTPLPARRRSPDSKIGLAENSTRLAASENMA
jgi:hypothetical protein